MISLNVNLGSLQFSFKTNPYRIGLIFSRSCYFSSICPYLYISVRSTRRTLSRWFVEIFNLSSTFPNKLHRAHLELPQLQSFHEILYWVKVLDCGWINTHKWFRLLSLIKVFPPLFIQKQVALYIKILLHFIQWDKCIFNTLPFIRPPYFSLTCSYLFPSSTFFLRIMC